MKIYLRKEKVGAKAVQVDKIVKWKWEQKSETPSLPKKKKERILLNVEGLNAMKVNMREESESENLFRRHLMVVLLHWLVRSLRTRAIMTRDLC